METHLGSLHMTRHVPDWPAAAVAGFAAGAVLMVLDLLWSSFVVGDGPWRTSHLIASIFAGPEGLQSADRFSVGVVAIALATHYALGIVFGLVMAAIMVRFNLDASVGRALVTGVVFGIVLYLINIDVVVRLAFPWLAELRGWATLLAHVVFGVVAALLYRKLQRTGAET
jgi:hypothetical protein